MSVKLLTEHHLEFLSLKGGCRGSSESTLVKMSNCWKSHVAAHLHRECKVKSSYLLSSTVFFQPMIILVHTLKVCLETSKPCMKEKNLVRYITS